MHRKHTRARRTGAKVRPGPRLRDTSPKRFAFQDRRKRVEPIPRPVPITGPHQCGQGKELAAAKSSDVSDIGRLQTGIYYAAVDGGSFAKIQTLCA